MTLPVISGGIAKGYAIFDEQDNYTYYEAFAEIYKMAEILKQSSDSLYIIGKDQSAVIRSTGAVSEFRGVYIDGMEVSANDYILTEGLGSGYIRSFGDNAVYSVCNVQWFSFFADTCIKLQK